MPSIREAALELILGASRETYPREFIALLRGEGDLIEEVLVVPASVYGSGFSSLRRHMLPMDRSVIGSVHSHPSGNHAPSKGDLFSFGKRGGFHLIVRFPAQSIDDIACYDDEGNMLTLRKE
jgi:proteasome lid subunit RPN8/RPN11